MFMTASYLYIFLLMSVFPYAKQTEKKDVMQIRTINYNLSNPDKIYHLPHGLHEISGITELDASSIACIQDEFGILYIYDFKKEEIKEQYYFHHDGDYEGIARVSNSVYILRSDGKLFKVPNYKSGNEETVSYDTGLPSNNNEGLCFDSAGNRLLIAPKGQVGKKSENKDLRYIYGFDLKSKRLKSKPVFVFDLSVIKKFALENKINVPIDRGKKGNKNEPVIEFRTSAIGINPIINKLFVLSGMEQLLLVFDMKGNIEYMEKLDPDLYNQPEGITFLSNGDMLISNESKKKKPSIVRCNYLKNRTPLSDNQQ